MEMKIALCEFPVLPDESDPHRNRRYVRSAAGEEKSCIKNRAEGRAVGSLVCTRTFWRLYPEGFEWKYLRARMLKLNVQVQVTAPCGWA